MATGDKREAIMQAALELLAERGFHGAPMAQIAQRAGVSAGIIYHYFAGKEDLIYALYRRIKARFGAALFAGADEEGAPGPIFRQVWLNAYHFYRDHPVEARFLDQFESSPYRVAGADAALAEVDARAQRIAARFYDPGPAGITRPLGGDALYELSFGVAARLARRHSDQAPAAPADLAAVADAIWRAIGR